MKSTLCRTYFKCIRRDLDSTFALGLRSYDGNCNENFTLKLNFALSKVFCDNSMLVRLYKIGGVHFRLLGTNVFHLKLENEGFTTELALSSEPQI